MGGHQECSLLACLLRLTCRGLTMIALCLTPALGAVGFKGEPLSSAVLLGSTGLSPWFCGGASSEMLLADAAGAAGEEEEAATARPTM